MTRAAAADPAAALAAVTGADRGRLLSALIGQLRDFQLAEDCLQDALASALEHWRRGGIPSNPAAWLLTVARRKAIDRLRRASVAERKAADYEYLLRLDQEAGGAQQDIPDERLRLIFTCCHPALDLKTRVALTLRTLGGLTTDEIARAYLDKPATMAQRLARARGKIARAKIPFAVPEGPELAERVQGVARVIYLIFNEGYAATEGAGQIRVDLCNEAVFLARLMHRLYPGEAEIEGLLALILLSHARSAARTGPGGVYVPLSEQDRSLWDAELIAEGTALVEEALARGRAGPYQLQAAIAALHCEADSHAATDWAQIAALYRLLGVMQGGDVARLNEAVALSYAGELDGAVERVERLGGSLAAYQPYHAAHADLLARAGRPDAAAAAYRKALDMTRIESERRFLGARLSAVRRARTPSAAR